MNKQLIILLFILIITGIATYAIGSYNQKYKTDFYRNKIAVLKLIGFFTFEITTIILCCYVYYHLFENKELLIPLTFGFGVVVIFNTISLMTGIQYLSIELSKTTAIKFNTQEIMTFDKERNDEKYSEIKRVEIFKSKWDSPQNPLGLLEYIIVYDADNKKHIITEASINIDRFINRLKGIRKEKVKKRLLFIKQ